MKPRFLCNMIIVCLAQGLAADAAAEVVATDSALGRIEVATIPWPPELDLRTATYTTTGEVLVVYNQQHTESGRQVSLAVMNDDGTRMRPVFSGVIPYREKDNGIRYMVLPDNQRIFLGDYVLECVPSLSECERSKLVPVEYPAEIAAGEHVSHRWSEIIVAPDNRHIAWTTLFANYSAMMFTGELQRGDTAYRIAKPRIISTLDPFQTDPRHIDGVIPQPVRNGEVKQFVHGGTGISLVGAQSRDTADSMVQKLQSGELVQITDTPGYNETTIFSPDESLGITMTTRFSERTNLAVLGLLPRPYPASLNMGLNMHTYIYGVAGVRTARAGNIGPALIDIEASKAGGDYRGINLNTRKEWVYHSPMSWHPDGNKALWLEGLRGEEEKRMQVVHLPEREPSTPVVARITPDSMPYAIEDLSVVHDFVQRGNDLEVRVYGKASGYIDYRRNARGLIDKRYFDFSDDGQQVYNGRERMQLNPAGHSVYIADIQLEGPRPGEMDLQITFGPLSAELPARIIFADDEAGDPRTYGYAEFAGTREAVDSLIP